jgi:hypothetical protein
MWKGGTGTDSGPQQLSSVDGGGEGGGSSGDESGNASDSAGSIRGVFGLPLSRQVPSDSNATTRRRAQSASHLVKARQVLRPRWAR